jgi:hypothetical protein
MNPDLNEILNSSDPELKLYLWACDYGRLPKEYEQLLIEIDNGWYLYRYTINILKRRWPEAEKKLLEIGDGWELYHYAINIVKERWIEAEPILKKSDHWEHYSDHFKI